MNQSTSGIILMMPALILSNKPMTEAVKCREILSWPIAKWPAGIKKSPSSHVLVSHLSGKAISYRLAALSLKHGRSENIVLACDASAQRRQFTMNIAHFEASMQCRLI